MINFKPILGKHKVQLFVTVVLSIHKYLANGSFSPKFHFAGEKGFDKSRLKLSWFTVSGKTTELKWFIFTNRNRTYFKFILLPTKSEYEIGYPYTCSLLIYFTQQN